MIEMIEMIEMILGSAGWGCAFGGAPMGGRVGDMSNFGPLGSGVGYGFSLWFEGFGEIVSWGRASWEGSGGGRGGDVLKSGPLGSGVGQGFPRWFEVIETTGD